MKSKRRALTPDLALRWAELAHIFFIDALSTSTPLSIDKVSFHGGTNLHLSWGSPRFSEDLDFLVSRELGPRIHALMPKIEKRMRLLAAATDPDLKVEIRDKTKDENGLLNFRIVLTSPGVVGQVMAKAEFWQVDQDYLQNYSSKFVQLGKPQGIASRISQPIPVASLEAAFADKVVAIGYRPHLKWRDLFDLWWIDNQNQFDLAERIPDILHHASAYKGPDGKTLVEGLEGFLARDPEEIFGQADPDLKRWLPKSLWASLEGQGVRDMVDNARRIAEEVIRHIAPDDHVKESQESHDNDANSGP